ncbi:MAG: endolytic transglycosylase MltG [Gammaproteobacteria bacterium]|nr:endolytic transglycosylase MltG [Gammaproteobacteria bacterium]
MPLRGLVRVGLVMVAALVVCGALVQNLLQQPLDLPPEGMVLELSSGTTLRRVAMDLAARGVVSQPDLLVLLGRYRGDAVRLKQGEYQLDAGITPPQLLDQLVAGRVITRVVTLLEGWTFAQIRAALADSEALQNVTAGLSDAEVMTRLGYPEQLPEGRFFPDSYQYRKGDSDLDLLARAYRAMEKNLAQAWQTRDPDLPLTTPYEALILASIVERESGGQAERRRIAGVFVRRLRLGMKLQSDPTVIYAIGPAYDGNITRRHLQLDRPHNTYVRYGLPPTPIASPGLASLLAVMHPEDGDSLYFVARGEGRHYFSSTLRQHNQAVNYYQLGRGREPPQTHE